MAAPIRQKFTGKFISRAQAQAHLVAADSHAAGLLALEKKDAETLREYFWARRLGKYYFNCLTY